MNFTYEDIRYNTNLLFKVFLHGVHFVDKHFHDDVEILFVLDGNIEIKYGLKEVILSEGNIIVINPNIVHSIKSNDENLSLLLQIPRRFFSVETNKKIDLEFKCITTEEMQTNEYLGE